MTEQRFENRYLCADLVRVDWLTGEDDFQSAGAVLEDICGLGACVQVEEPIPLGATVILSIGDKQFAGYVCYCAYRDYGYFVGVRFAEETVWSRDAVMPQHMTDLAALGK